jgi:hypothetical protein
VVGDHDHREIELVSAIRVIGVGTIVISAIGVIGVGTIVISAIGPPANDKATPAGRVSAGLGRGALGGHLMACLFHRCALHSAA